MQSSELFDPWDVMLVVTSGIASAAELTERIGVNPDRTWSKGERGSRPDGTPRPSTNGIAFEAGGRMETREHLAASIVERVGPHRQALAETMHWLRERGDPNIGLSLTVISRFASESHGLRIGTKELQFLTDVGAALDIEMEYWGSLSDD